MSIASTISGQVTQPPVWRSFAVPMFKGQFDTRIASEENYPTRTLGALWGVDPTNKPKAMAPAIIPSLYCGPDARNHGTQRKRGQYVALTGDIDKGNVPLERLFQLSRDLFGPQIALFIYSTGSSTSADKRWRIIAPLEKPVSFVVWNEGQRAFFQFMEKNGVPMDRSLARSAQPVYLPNVPPERRQEDGEPSFYQYHAEGGRGLAL